VWYRELPPLPGQRPRHPDLTSDRSTRRLQWVATLVTPLAIVGLIAYQVLRNQDLPGGLATDETSGSESSVNLLEDPTPALEALAGVYEGPPQVRELVLNPDLATMDVQVPDGSGHVDEYLWHADGTIGDPEPVDEAIAALHGEPFALAEIDPAILPITAQNMLQNCPGDGLALTHVVIQRDTNLDPQGRTLMLIYASNPERGDGGYIAYTLDGTFVADHCTS